MSQVIQAIRGMSDVLPETAPLWDFFESTVRDWLSAYGYQQIRLPIVEKTELFKRSIGEATDIVEKEMYTFTDALNGDSLTLRPEGTASCVRAVLQHNLLYASPQRLFYYGPMFRHERPQKGRYRQFYQVGVESLGFSGPDMDVEHIAMTARLWLLLGLNNIRLQINSLGSAAARSSYRTRLIGYFERHLDQLSDDARRRLHANPMRLLDSKDPAMQEVIAQAPQLTDDLDAEAADHYAAVLALLDELGIQYECNPRLVRGLDYYNNTVYEWVTDALGAQSAVCSGGRYDALVEQLGGKPAPACGFAMGVERLILLLQERASLPEVRTPDVYLLHRGAGAEQAAFKTAERLRDANCAVVLHCGGGSLKTQMKKADSSGAHYALIIGEEELATQQLTLKPLRVAGEQKRAALPEIITLLTEKHGCLI